MMQCGLKSFDVRVVSRIGAAVDNSDMPARFEFYRLRGANTDSVKRIVTISYLLRGRMIEGISVKEVPCRFGSIGG